MNAHDKPGPGRPAAGHRASQPAGDPQEARRLLHAADRQLQKAAQALHAQSQHRGPADPDETRELLEQLRYLSHNLSRLLGHAGEAARRVARRDDLVIDGDLSGSGVPGDARQIAATAIGNLLRALESAETTAGYAARAAMEFGVIAKAGAPARGTRKDTP